MALPVILVNSATGSDTQASGAGPSTALFGTTDASFSGATVTLTAGTDLTNVATDGSHVLYLLTSTGVRFFKITAKAGSGGATPTVDVTPSPAGTSTGRTWAIGGKRASIGSSSSRFLIDNGGAAGDWKPGWAIEFQSGHTETISSRLDVHGAGDTTDGPCIIRGASGAATKPVLTFSGAGTDIVPRSNYQIFKDFTMTGVSSASSCFITVGSNYRFERLTISGFSGVLFENSGSTGLMQSHVIGCDLNGGTNAVKVSQNCRVIGNRIRSQTSHGITGPSANMTGLEIVSNLIYSCGADGINIVQSRTDQYASVMIAGNTINGCTGDGIDYSGDADGLTGLTIFNNLITSNGAYGINFTSLTAAKVLARGTFVSHNNTYNNTSGACNLTGVLESDGGLNPTYASSGSGDFTPTNTSLEGTAFPLTLP